MNAWLLRFASSAPPAPLTGLQFPQNGDVVSVIRLLWDSSNLLSRTSHTAIWRANYTQQTGYYAVAWHSYNDGTFHGDNYEYGTHPYPAADGTVDANGEQITGTSSTGTVHWWEIAGLTHRDFLASAGGGPGVQVTKGVWYTQARTCSIQGANLRHRFYPDVVNNPSFVIEQVIALADLQSPSSPAFYFGASDWRDGTGGSGGNSTDESPSCILRGISLFNTELSLTDITTEGASASNSPATSAGASSVWYINKNPTPTDITDKSGAGHNPSWANANRPTLWTG